MNTNLLTINTICSKPIHMAPRSHKAGMGRKDRQVFPIQDDISPKLAPHEMVTSNNNPNNSRYKSVDKALHESDHTLPKRAKTEGPLEDQDGTKPKEPSPVSEMNKQPDLEAALWAEKYGLTEQSSEEGGEGIVKTQFAPPSPNSQGNSLPLAAGEAVESAHIGLLRTDEGQAIPKSVLIDTSESTPTAKNHFERGENTDTIPLSIPTGATAHARARANIASTEELISGASAGTRSMRGTDENKPVITDTSAAAETPGRPVSSTKDLVFDGFVDDDGKTTAGDGKAATMNIHLASAQAKSSETRLHVVEADSDKRVPTDEAFSELQNPKGKMSTHTENGLSNAAGVKESSKGEFQTSTSQPEGQSRSSDNHNLQANLEQILIQNHPPTPISQQPLTSAENAKTAHLPGQTSPNEVSADVGKQILESIQSSLIHQGGDRQITIRLNPPDLGKVFIRFQEQNTELTGLLEVNKAETRIEIEQALPQMIRDLADCGIQIRRLDVMLSEENRSGTLGDQSPQNNGPHEQDSADSETWGNEAYPNGINEWSPNNNSYQHISELQEMLVSDGSVNVLV